MLLVPIITMLVVIIVNLMITRIATVALTYTGLSRELARFQARSAYTTVGFTTAEAERITQHPVRRRIIMLLMILGNAGVAAMIASMAGIMFTAGSGSAGFVQDTLLPLLAMAAGLVFLWFFATSKWIDDKLFNIIGWMLQQFTDLDVVDYTGTLHFGEGYRVTEFMVDEGHWTVGKTLGELRISDEGLQLLAIHRKDGTFVPTPTGRTHIREGDCLAVYGLMDEIRGLANRKAGPEGDEAYRKGCAAHAERIEQQTKDDPGEPEENFD